VRSRKRFALIAFVALLVAAGSAFVAWNWLSLGDDTGPGERSHAVLRILTHQPRIIFSTEENAVDYPAYVRTQCALIKSPVVLSGALSQVRIANLPTIRDQPDAVGWLGRNLVVASDNDSEIIQIFLASRSGARRRDQPAIINAVLDSYKRNIVDQEVQARFERQEQLRKIYDQYASQAEATRRTLREKAASAGIGDPFQEPKQDGLLSLRQDFTGGRVKLRLDQAEARTLLARRKQAAGAQADPIRKEIAQLEDRLAVLTEQEKVLDEEENKAVRQHKSAAPALDLKMEIEAITQAEAAVRRLGELINALDIERHAPGRIAVLALAQEAIR
jgi:hypothetical protein